MSEKKGYSFGEKIVEKIQDKTTKEWKDAQVWKTPKYEQSKRKAIELIESGKYGLEEGDFWILMNATKNGKMNYTGLIISHTACLKINDKLEKQFAPESVSIDKQGYQNSLVFSYCNSAQGLYEVGEVSSSNCKNEYPYAMGFKRLFDRVVLKLSKISFDGIYSEAESDSFKEKDQEEKEKQPQNAQTQVLYSKYNPQVKAEVMLKLSKFIAEKMKMEKVTFDVMKQWFEDNLKSDLTKCAESYILEVLGEK